MRCILIRLFVGNCYSYHNYMAVKCFSLFLLIFITGCSENTQLLRDGDAHASKGEWDKAYIKYSEAYSNKPDKLLFKVKYLQSKSNAAIVHFDRGEALAADGNYEGALLEYQAALMLDANHEKALRAVKETTKKIDSIYYYGKGVKNVEDGRFEDAAENLKRSVRLDPSNVLAKESLDKLIGDSIIRLDGFELSITSTKPITLDFKNTKVKKAFNVLSKLSGINFVFDNDMKDKNTTVHLQNATFQEALSTILMINELSRKVVNENTIIIYPSTPKKAKQYEELKIEAFYLENTDAKKMVNLLRTMIKARDIYVHEDLNAIVVRAKPEALELARKILNATDLSGAEVVLEVEVMEVTRNDALDFGLDIDPMSISASFNDGGASGTPGGGAVFDYPTLTSLSKRDLFITIPYATYTLKKSKSNSNVLANPRIRVKNNEKAEIHIGEKVPIITVVVTDTTTSDKIEFQKVGLELNVEPMVRPNDEVDLKIELKVSTLGTKVTTPSGSVAYQFGTRSTKTSLRLRDGETQIIGGLFNEEERSTVVKLPIIGDFPIIGTLFSSIDKSKVKTDILLSITPHVVRNIDIPPDNIISMWSGSQDSPSNSRSANVASKRSDIINVGGNNDEDLPEEYKAPPPPPMMFDSPPGSTGMPGLPGM